MTKKVELLTRLRACVEAVEFVKANPRLSWPKLARKSKRLDWTLWLLSRYGEPGFSLGHNESTRIRRLLSFAAWCVAGTVEHVTARAERYARFAVSYCGNTCDAYYTYVADEADAADDFGVTTAHEQMEALLRRAAKHSKEETR